MGFQSDTYALLGTGTDAVSAVGAIAFLWPGLHVADLAAMSTVVAGRSLVHLERCHLLHQFENGASRAGKTAPSHGHKEACRHNGQQEAGTKEPHGKGVLKGQAGSSPEVAYANGNVDPGLVQDKVDDDTAEKNQVFHVAERYVGRGNHPELERILGQNASQKSSRTDPAAKGTATQGSQGKPCTPDTPEGMCHTAGAGKDRAVLAADEGNDKGATEDAIQGPFAQKGQGQPLQNPVCQKQTLETKPGLLCRRTLIRAHRVPPVFRQVPAPWQKWQV